MKHQKKGAVTFEWIILFTLVLIGIIGGWAIIRDALIIETVEVGDAILHNNKTYMVSHPAEVTVSYSGKGTNVHYSHPSYAIGSRYVEPFIPGTSHLVIARLPEEEEE